MKRALSVSERTRNDPRYAQRLLGKRVSELQEKVASLAASVSALEELLDRKTDNLGSQIVDLEREIDDITGNFNWRR